MTQSRGRPALAGRLWIPEPPCRAVWNPVIDASADKRLTIDAWAAPVYAAERKRLVHRRYTAAISVHE